MGRSRMKRGVTFGSLAAALFLVAVALVPWDAAATAADPTTGAQKADHRGERVLLKFDGTLDGAERSALLERYSLEVEESLDSIGALVVAPAAASGTARGEDMGGGGELSLSSRAAGQPDLDALSREPGVAWAEPDTLFYFDKVPNDPDYVYQWYLPAVGLPTAWDVSTGVPTTIVAVLDTGLANHNEFLGRVVSPHSVIRKPPNQSDVTDLFGHGTAVAAVVAAQGDNGSLISGTAWGVGIMPIHISNDGSAYASDMALAIEYAVDHGADVINISAGSDKRNETVAAGIAYAQAHDVLVVAASGNGSRNDLVQHPAALPGVVAVGSIGESKARSAFSNGGPELDLVAPGEKILTLIPPHPAYPSDPWLEGFVSGTSFATPIVSGVAGLIRSVAPSMSVKRMAELLSYTAADLGPTGWDQGYGDGLVDAGSALVSAVDTTLPEVAFLSPAPGVTVGGDVLVSMEIFDAVGVVRLEIRSNGKPLGSFVPRAPNPGTWDMAKWGPWMVNSMKSPIKFVYDTNGDTHDSLVTIEAKASDAAGNSRTAKVTVRINNRPPLTYTTLTGADRYETAILVSKQAYPSGAPAVCVVKGDDFPDALSAAPLAYAFGGPVILTPSGGLTPAVKAELQRLKPGKVFFIGLPEAVRSSLVDAVGSADIVTIRGKDRYETAALLAAQLKTKLGKVEKIVLASGDRFPDALSVAPMAARQGWPILLTPQAGPLPKVISSQIQALGATSALVVGTYLKPSGISVTSKIGKDRYHTSALVAEYGTSMGLSFAHLALATGENYPDALVAASLLVSDQGLLVLTRSSVLPSYTKSLLTSHRANMARMDFVGLPAGIVSEVKTLLK